MEAESVLTAVKVEPLTPARLHACRTALQNGVAGVGRSEQMRLVGELRLNTEARLGH